MTTRSLATGGSLPPPTNGAQSPAWLDAFIDSHNVPVDFYGLVVDQDSNALPGVALKVAVEQWTLPSPASLEGGTREVHLERVTGADGRFEINGVRGDTFDLESMVKEGYEAEPIHRGFGPTGGGYVNPVVFKMWSTNIHERLISSERSFHIVPDGRPYVIDFTKGTIAESGTGDLRVWVRRPEQIVYGQRYDWSCELDAINGWQFLRADASDPMYEAPMEGYTASPFTYEESATANGWGDTTGTQKFYLKLSSGQEYGRISIELEAYHNSQIPGLVRLSYAINPSGSRVLR